MGRKAIEKGAIQVARLTKPGYHFVGGVDGLALQILPTGGRTWILRATIAGKRRDMGLGGYPDVPLSQAREAARQARAKIREGIDPIEYAIEKQSQLKAAKAANVTFQECAARYIASHESSWTSPKSSQQWTSSLATYAYPFIGSLLVRDIDLPNVLEVLEPIWRTKTETASRVRSRMETVLDWAQVNKYRHGLNPARWRGHLDKILPAPGSVQVTVPQPALPLNEMGAFMARLRGAEGIGARALEFLILTAVRSEVVRGAVWSEIDFTESMWNIPKERMKGLKGKKKPHRVPLCPDAIKLLNALPRMAGTDLIFPAPRGKKSEGELSYSKLSDGTLAAVINRFNELDNMRWVDPTANREAVPHGFRSTFRDWASEISDYPSEMAEMALAHTVADKVEAAYRRGDLFLKRHKMMADWAKFCATPKPLGVVVNFQEANQATA